MKNNVSLSVKVFIIAILYTFNMYSQLIPPTIHEGKLSPGGIFDTITIVSDDLSPVQKVHISELDVNSKKPDGMGGSIQAYTLFTCSSGYFDIYLESGSLMEGNSAAEINRRNVLCQVLSDVSNFITNNGGLTNKVRLLIRNQNAIINASTSMQLGRADIYLALPSVAQNTVGGLMDYIPWITINSGQDAYTNLISPYAGTFFHGALTFNFSNTSILWNDAITAGPSSGQIDLYTTMLHELTHVLGYMTLIDYLGTSRVIAGPYYARWDKFLTTNNGTPLLNSATCPAYTYSWNIGALPNPINILSPQTTTTCGPLPSSINANNTSCSVAIQFAGTYTTPVYTQDCFMYGTSIMHTEDQCYAAPSYTPIPPNSNNLYFLMSENSLTGAASAKRFFRPEERSILCDLGYKVGTSFGTNGNFQHTPPITYTGSSCPGISVAGVNDGILANGLYAFTSSVGVASIPISPLVNDYGFPVSYDCLQIIYGNGTLSNTTGTSFSYTPLSQGLHVLRYTPVAFNGERGNITYIHFYAYSTSCNTSCDFVHNGNLESSFGCGYQQNVTYTINCWSAGLGTPDLFQSGCSGANIPITTMGWPNINTWNNATGTMYGIAAADKFNESIQAQLSSPLLTGSSYTFSAWIYTRPLSGSASKSLTFDLAASSGPFAPAVASTSVYPSGVSVIGTFTIPQVNQWTFVSIPITYTGAVNANFLQIRLPYSINITPASNEEYIGFIDEISIKTSSTASIFSMPAITCTGNTYTLNPMVSIPGGVFTGPGVTNNSGTYVFNASSAGTGSHTLVYSYTVAGCSLQTYAQTNVTSTPTISIATSTQVICPGTSSITYTASGASSYTWASASQTVTGNPATLSPSITTNYMVYGESGGCVGTTTLSVPVNSVCVCSYDPNIAYNFPTTSFTISGASHSGLGLPRYSINSNILIAPTASISPTISVNFYAAEFAIAPNVSITVASGATLTISKCHLYACNDMWQGIVVQNGGYLVIDDDALIEDAITAIDITAHTNTVGKILKVNTVVFNKNYTAVSVNSYTPTLATYPFEISNSVFTSRQFTANGLSWPQVAPLKTTCTVTNNLASPYCLQNFPLSNLKAPYSSQSAYIGVNANYVGRTTNASVTPTYYSLTVGDYTTTSNFNIFDNLYYGIAATDANLKVYNNVFQNMQWQFVFPGGFIGGKGISHNTSTVEPNTCLNLTPPSPYYNTRKNKFYDCTYGVHANNIFEIKASYMEFRSLQNSSGAYQPGKFGIYSTSDRFRSYEINNNLMYNIENGTTFNSTYGKVKLSGTTYTNTQYAGTVSIGYNTIKPRLSGAITSEFVSTGVNAQNILSSGSTQTVLAGSLIKVYGNIITDAYRGVYATNFKTPPLHAASNFVTLKTDPANNTQYGISLNTCDNATVSTNNITGPNTTNTLITAIYASLNNNPSVTCNTVSTSYQGFEFAQSQPGTVWKGNSMTNHQLGMALTYTGVIGAQGSTGNPIDNAWNNPSFWSGGNFHTWTFNSVASSSTLYVQNLAIYYPTNNAGSPNPQSYAFGSVSLTTGAYSCGGGGSGASMVQSNNLTSGSSSSAQLESISKDGSNYVAQNQLYRYLYNNPNAKTGNTQLQLFYNSNNTTNIGKLNDIENSLAGGNFILASSLISSVNTSNSIETNYKDFYNLYKKFFNSGVLSSTDNLTLLNICNKCPLTDGAVIYQARALYNVANNTVESYIDNCPRNDNFSSRLIGMSGIAENDYSWSINLYPNPASDELFIGTDSENEELIIQIIDVTGKMVTSEKIRTKEFIGRLNLSLKDGIYFVNLTNKNKETIVKKLVISK